MRGKRERVISISKKLQIDSVLQKYPYEISGGQKKDKFSHSAP